MSAPLDRAASGADASLRAFRVPSLAFTGVWFTLRGEYVVNDVGSGVLLAIYYIEGPAEELGWDGRRLKRGTGPYIKPRSRGQYTLEVKLKAPASGSYKFMATAEAIRPDGSRVVLSKAEATLRVLPLEAVAAPVAGAVAGGLTYLATRSGTRAAIVGVSAAGAAAAAAYLLRTV